MTGFDLTIWLAIAMALCAPAPVAYAVYLGWQALRLARENRARLERLEGRLDNYERWMRSLDAEVDPTLLWRSRLAGRVEALEGRTKAPQAPAPTHASGLAWQTPKAGPLPPPPRLPGSLGPGAPAVVPHTPGAEEDRRGATSTYTNPWLAGRGRT